MESCWCLPNDEIRIPIQNLKSQISNAKSQISNAKSQIVFISAEGATFPFIHRILTLVWGKPRIRYSPAVSKL
jgi:hypothetical protein